MQDHEINYLSDIKRVLSTGEPREASAARLARLIREARSYRWVGIYEVAEQEIVLLGSSNVSQDTAHSPASESTQSGNRGAGDIPAYPRFPVSQGPG